MPRQYWIVCLVAVVILIGGRTSRAEDATPTPYVGETISYTVQPGDTLGRIATRFGTTTRILVALNQLANPELIVIGQRLLIPVQADSATAAPDLDTPTAPETSGEPGGSEAAARTPGFDYGVEVFANSGDFAIAAQQVSAMGMQWAKVTLSWRELETSPGAIDFGRIDTLIDQLQGLSILLTITDAPDWARSSTVENGPPDSFGDYAAFAGAVAARYTGRVQAYEVWNEPNLRREWNSTIYPISASAYADLLRAAYGAIKAADPAAQVISAGLAPTGFDDGMNAINDRAYLTELYAAGLAAISDGVGVHPYGFGNPPDSVCCAAPDGITSHYGHPSFYFLDTLRDTRTIMMVNGDADASLWVTRFGWGTNTDGVSPSRNSQFITYNSLDQQAAYMVRAYELGGQTDYIRVMIGFNLNGCGLIPANAEACYYSIIGADGTPRPVYDRLSTIFASAVTP